MKNVLPASLACLVLAAAAAGPGARPIAAHHAVTPFYDLSKSVEFDGVVTRWIFKNPHSFLFLMVTDDQVES